MSPNAPMDDLLDEPRRDRRRSGRCRVGGTHPGGQPTTAHTYTPLTMKGHAFTAYLRIYQPLAAFPPRERAEWAAYVEAGQVLPASLLVGREERRGLARALGLTVGADREHALVERVGDVVFLCPLRTELRTLQSLVAFSSSVPEEVADAFVPAGDVERAEQTLERWESERPGSRSHIQQAAWHVPLPWFALFEDGERRGGGPSSGPGGPRPKPTTL